MTSVYFAATGSGEDGDEYDVEDVFATRELAEAFCNRPDKPRWSHPYVEEWEVTGALLTAAERDAIEGAIIYMETRGVWAWPEVLRGLLDRLS